MAKHQGGGNRMRLLRRLLKREPGLKMGLHLIGTGLLILMNPQARADETQMYQTPYLDWGGHARLYDYQRWRDQNSDRTTRALAGGGDLKINTHPLAGFSLGLGFYSENALLPYRDDGPRRVNSSLIGPDENHLNTFAEAYLQYQQGPLRVRFGRQLINTPWANTDMYTMLPRAFYGAATDLSLLHSDGAKAAPLDWSSARPQLELSLARMTRYESRFDDAFTAGNRYDPDANLPGLFVGGLKYRQQFSGGGIQAQAWTYQFFDYAKLQYLEAGYQMPALLPALRPYLKLQYVHENEAGAQALGPVQAQVYGAKLGLDFEAGGVALVWDHAPVHYDSYRHGSLVHPYNDLSGTLYTDTMNNGLDDLGPGSAYGLTGSWRFLQRALELKLAYVRYRVEYGHSGDLYDRDGAYGFPANPTVSDQRQWGFDFGLTYQLGQLWSQLRGLSIFNNVGIRSYSGGNDFIDDRLGLIYGF